jgi:hypothetical protein
MTEPNPSWAQPEDGSSAPASAPSPAPIAVPRKKGGNLTNILLVVAAAIAIGGIAFAVGRTTAPTAAAGGFRGGNGQFLGGQGVTPNGSFAPGQGGPGGFGGDRALTISGTVKSIDGTTMTITTANGNETTIDISGTTYHSQAPATAADVKPGATVAVEVTGFGGFRGGPDASGAPDANGAPDAGGTGTIKATDVTIKAE